MMSEVSIMNVEPQLVVGLRKRGTYAQIRPMMTEIRQFIAASGARTAPDRRTADVRLS